MIVESAGIVFAVPVDSVKAVVRLQPEAITQLETQLKTDGSSPRSPRTYLTWNEISVELIQPQQWLRFHRPNPPFEMEGTPTINKPVALLINQDNQWRGICIDRYWGEQEISLRPVNSPIPLPPGFSGSTVLGDGRVIPLVDPFSFLEWVAEAQMAPDLTLAETLDELKSQPPVVPAITPDPTMATILVVDDSINVRRYLAMTLEKSGYQVEQAKDGQEAVEKLLAGLPVQAVVCDIEMPRLDGYGVLSEVKSRSAFKDLPIVMLTSRMNEKHRKIALNLGASAYFSKPYNEQELLKTLREFVSL